MIKMCHGKIVFPTTLLCVGLLFCIPVSAHKFKAGNCFFQGPGGGGGHVVVVVVVVPLRKLLFPFDVFMISTPIFYSYSKLKL